MKKRAGRIECDCGRVFEFTTIYTSITCVVCGATYDVLSYTTHEFEEPEVTAEDEVSI